MNVKSGNNTAHNAAKIGVPSSSAASEEDMYLGNSCTIAFPIVEQKDISLILPEYSAVLGRSVEDGFNMNSLDKLQQDLEKCLSASAVRHRLLIQEVESLDLLMEQESDKKEEQGYEQPSVKPRNPNEKLHSNSAKSATGLRDINYVTLPNISVPKISIPKNKKADKFWLLTDSYCADVTRNDITFLDHLIQECSQNMDVEIPDLANHNSTESIELLKELNLGRAARAARAKNSLNNKKRLDVLFEPFSSPISRRFSAPAAGNTVDTLGSCVGRKLRRKLFETEILEEQNDDEILREIKNATKELQAVSEKNVSQLIQLRTLAAQDLCRQEVKKALDKVDTLVVEISNKILIEKQKHAPKSGVEACCNKGTCSRKNLIEYEEEAVKLLQRQAALSKKLNEFSNATLPV